MKVILWRRPDGGFSFTPFGETKKAALAHADDLLKLADYAGWTVEGICNDADMPDGGHGARPAARAFRNAWDIVNGKPILVMDRARDLHRDRLRVARAPLLAATDVDYQRADENGDLAQKTAVAARKQALRDITKHPAIDAAETPEDLAALTLEALTASL